MKEKYKKALDEVMDEINTALEDPKGIVAHQRRIAFSISLGMATLVESYFEELDILKSGARINHSWFKKKKANIKERLSNQITCPIDEVEYIDEILDIAYNVERERDRMAYGKPVSEQELRNYLKLYFKLKNLIENA